MSLLFMNNSPLVILSSPPSKFNIVDLPLPDLPTIKTRPLLPIFRLILFKALVSTPFLVL